MQEQVWGKKLSKTDAQQETSGGLVPYLRLTRGADKNVDYQTWFRTDFFGSQNWQAAKFGREDVEQCKVVMDVIFCGVSLGDKVFLATHGQDRWESNNAPNTWVHWPTEIQGLLQKNDLSGQRVQLIRESDGSFTMILGD